MNVLRGILMQMVVPVLGRPPQHALLRARLGQQCKQKLECPAGRIGSGREVPVIASPDGKDAKPEKPKEKRDSLPGDSRPNGRQASQMNQYEWYGRRIDDIFVFGVGTIVASFSHFCFFFSPAFDKVFFSAALVAVEDFGGVLLTAPDNVSALGFFFRQYALPLPHERLAITARAGTSD